MNMIEVNLMKYVPKKVQPFVTTLYKQCAGVYALAIEIDGQEIAGACDGVKEIYWAANYMLKNREFNF